MGGAGDSTVASYSNLDCTPQENSAKADIGWRTQALRRASKQAGNPAKWRSALSRRRSGRARLLHIARTDPKKWARASGRHRRARPKRVSPPLTGDRSPPDWAGGGTGPEDLYSAVRRQPGSEMKHCEVLAGLGLDPVAENSSNQYLWRLGNERRRSHRCQVWSKVPSRVSNLRQRSAKRLFGWFAGGSA